MFNSLDLLVAASACGIGLVVSGVGLIACPSRPGRIGFVVASLLTTVAGSWAISSHAALAVAMVGLAGGAAVLTRWAGRTAPAEHVRQILFRPAVLGPAIVLVGAGLIAAGTWRYDRAEISQSQRELELRESVAAWHPNLLPAEIVCKTDGGTPVTVYRPVEARTIDVVRKSERTLLDGLDWEKFVIERGPADDRSNCHGWVFTGGKYWVKGEDVLAILHGNGYKAEMRPRTDDVAVYYDDKGNVTHTGIVRSVGAVTMVESKWSWMGVYLHAAGDSCYGKKIVYYRANRNGHQFAALSPVDAKPAARPPVPGAGPFRRPSVIQ